MNGPARSSRPGWEFLLLACALLLLGVILCLPLRYVSLLADEFCRSVRLREMSVWECVQYEYLHWTGRWLGFGLEYVVMSGHSWAPLYGIVLALIALFYWFALHSLISVLFPQLPASQRLLASGSLFALYWVGLSSTKDVFYWACGSIEYQLVMAVGILAVSWTLRAAADLPGKQNIFYFALAVLAAFCTPGLHELYGFVLCLVLLAGTGMAFLWRYSGKYVWLGVTLATMSGFAVSYLAPGNAVRMKMLEHAGEPAVAAKLSIMVMLQTLPDWVFDVRLITATLLLIVVWPSGDSMFASLEPHKRRHLRLMVPIVWLVLLAGSFLGPAWGTGRIIASRTLSPAYMIFLLGWFLNLALLLDWLQGKEIKLLTLHPLARKALVLFFAGSLLLTGNARRAIRELAGPLQQYASAREQRHNLLQRAGNEQAAVAVVPPLAASPDLIGFGELTPDPDNWINKCTAEYYGVGEIRIEDSK